MGRGIAQPLNIYMKKILQKIIAFLKKLLGSSDDGQTTPQPGQDTAKFKVENAYGGFNFTNAKEDATAGIENLVVNSNGMKYSWKKGCNLKNWGLSDTQADALAIFAVKGSNGVYRGGKFDWISKSRISRSFENIKSGYHGWPKNAIETAKGYAFCICSENGKKRTNWIFADKRSEEVTIRGGHTPIDKMDR